MITEFQNTYRYLADGDRAIHNRIELGIYWGYISPDYKEISEELAEFNRKKVAFRRACEDLEEAFEAAAMKRPKKPRTQYNDGAKP